MGNGSKAKVSKVVKIPGRVCDKNGNVQMEGTLNEVMIFPDAEFNLFSITRMTQSGWELSGNKDALVLKKNGMEIKFDIVIPTGKIVLYCMYFEWTGEVAGVGNQGSGKVKMTVGKVHRLLTHLHEDAERETAKRS